MLSRVRLKNKYFETSARSDSEASVKDPALSSYVGAHGGWCLFRDTSLPHSLTVPVSGIPHQEDHQKAVFSPWGPSVVQTNTFPLSSMLVSSSISQRNQSASSYQAAKIMEPITLPGSGLPLRDKSIIK